VVITKFILKKTNFDDAVVWNPYKEKISSIGDLGSDDWKKFVCVEAGNIGTKISLKPGEITKSIQVIGLSKI